MALPHLNKHPDVFISDKEVNFFDMDDVFQHPDYSYYENNQWVHHALLKDPKKYWNWYAKQFEGVDENQIIVKIQLLI